MAKRRIKRSRALRRKPRGWLSVVSIFITLTLVFLVSDADNGDYVDDPARIFAAFAELDLDLEGAVRMRASPLPPSTPPPEAPWRLIQEVVDGDSIKLNDGETVRLLGIDAPETGVNRKLNDDLRKMSISVRDRDLVALGRESAMFARRIAGDRRCWLEYEREKTDQYGRTLAYVHLEDGTILNEVMLRGGYAKVYLSQSFTYKKRYVVFQKEAQFRKRGLWRDGATR
ncbi:MAG: thermonuclease family protein [Planctomycetota bacterium]|jgi:micrococcal nuclease|nr:thermonuclease family protein [Planctomycetota bacterium]